MERSGPNLLGTTCVLAVQDLEQSVAFYRDKLGFETTWTDGGWHALRRGAFSIMLGECADDRSAFETRNHSYFAYIDVKGIDLLYHEFNEKGVEILSTVADKPWGQREFAIRTVDGHRIMFGEGIPG